MKMRNILKQIVWILLFSNCFSIKIYAQSSNSTIEIQAEIHIDSLAIEDSNKLDGPTRAALLSAVVPGLGQIYNNAYWKVPIIYSGFAVFAVVLDQNNYRYIYYRNAILAETDSDPNTIPPPFLTPASARRGADLYRRYRDLNIILVSAFYLLNIVEAHVDAHLQEFDINDDITVNLIPSLEHVFAIYSLGLCIQINY